MEQMQSFKKKQNNIANATTTAEKS